jgi:cytochrome c
MIKQWILALALVATFGVSSASFAQEEDTLVGDAIKGKKAFAKCKACHTYKKGGKNKVGPNLWNIVDRGIAEVEGFKYSSAFKAKKGEVSWDEATLSAYLKKPRAWEKKTKMAFGGIKKPQQLADLVAYLKTLKDVEEE